MAAALHFRTDLALAKIEDSGGGGEVEGRYLLKQYRELTIFSSVFSDGQFVRVPLEVWVEFKPHDTCPPPRGKNQFIAIGNCSGSELVRTGQIPPKYDSLTWLLLRVARGVRYLLESYREPTIFSCVLSDGQYVCMYSLDMAHGRMYGTPSEDRIQYPVVIGLDLVSRLQPLSHRRVVAMCCLFYK